MAAISAKNISNEEKFLNHLAGQDPTSSPIGKYEYYAAGKAQPHPVCNAVQSLLKGGIGGSCLAIGAFLASPFLNTTFRESVFGTVEKMKDGMLPIMHNLKNMGFEEYKGTAAYSGKSYSNPEEYISAHPDHVSSIGYYAHVLLENTLMHPVFIAGASIAAVAGCIYYAKNNADKREAEAEKTLVEHLQGRYFKIAEKLEAKGLAAEGNVAKEKEVRTLATTILTRKVEIDAEVEKLGLPRLKNVREITNPVYEAAEKIRLQFKE